MKKIGNLLLMAALLFSLCSCSHAYYVPNMQNIPLLQQKKELQLSGAISEGPELQAAYAFNNHFAAIAGASYTDKKFSTKSKEGIKFTLAEGGAGYFTKFNTKIILESYAGFGFGKVKNTYYEWHGTDFPEVLIGSTSMNLNRMFLQAAVGYTNIYYDFAFSTRFSAIKFTDIKGNENQASQIQSDLMVLKNNSTFLQLEPALTFRAGWDYVKLQTQIGWTYCISNKAFNYYSWSPNVNIGLFISLNNKYKS